MGVLVVVLVVLVLVTGGEQSQLLGLGLSPEFDKRCARVTHGNSKNCLVFVVQPNPY